MRYTSTTPSRLWSAVRPAAIAATWLALPLALLPALWRSEKMDRSDVSQASRSWRLCVAAFAVSGMAVLPSAPVGAQSGQQPLCPAFTAEDIDGCFLEWVGEIGGLEFVDLSSLVCKDDARDLTRIAFADRPVFLHVDAVTSGGDDGEFEVSIDSDPPSLVVYDLHGEVVAIATIVVCDSEAAGGPEASVMFTCRAEILRSFTWRQLCAKEVERSPDN